MKALHLCLFTLFVSLSATTAANDNPRPTSPRRGLGISARDFVPQFFHRPVETDVVFRAQSGEASTNAPVPLPPSAGGVAAGAPPVYSSPPATIQSYPAQQYPAQQYPVSAGPMSSGPLQSTVVPNQPYDPMYQGAAPGYPAGPGVTTWNAFSPPVTPDPFLQGQYAQPGYGSPGYGAPGFGGPYSPYGMAPGGYGGGSMVGANCAQPFRFGWQTKLDLELIPSQNVSAPAGGATGEFGQFGLDLDLGYGANFVPGWLSTSTWEFDMRLWDGPQGGVGLPGNVFRFGWDLQLETPNQGPSSIILGFNPSINTDFANSLSSDAWQLDGRGAVLFRAAPNWQVMLGALYWDRVDDLVLPWAGLIYTDDFWQWRMTFPEAQVRLFLGNEPYWSKWLYFRAEYHVESYEVSRTMGGAAARDGVEISDWRILGGFQMDAGYYRWFAEAGWIFDREIDFRSTTPGFDVDTGFITRVGWRY